MGARGRRGNGGGEANCIYKGRFLRLAHRNRTTEVSLRLQGRLEWNQEQDPPPTSLTTLTTQTKRRSFGWAKLVEDQAFAEPDEIEARRS